MSELLPVGTVAPRFTAQANDGRTLALDDRLEAGAVALFFYPGNTTPG
jgi:peroxiredoxin